jgi:2-polyprenyl-3-methyl-5-hydroxy-6-metoxy-1,4-benzoquinol methylase
MQNNLIKIITNKNIAIDSLDHKHPFGCIRDNNSSSFYISEVKQYFGNGKIKVMDLGCAGGQIIIDHNSLGDIAVGLEGSTHVFRGTGRHNWENYFNQNLFLCDITENFKCTIEDSELIFDYIQMWEVLEHIPHDKLSTLLQNISNHLTKDGLFCGSVATHVCPSGTHVSIFTKNEWEKIFDDNGFVLDEYKFTSLPRPVSEGDLGFVFTAQKK